MACRNHPQIEMGLDHCYRCGYRFCEECRVDFQGHPHCASCKTEAVSMLEAGAGSAGESASSAASGDLPPWERREQLGTMTAFVDTMKVVILSPTAFFDRFRVGITTWDCLAIPAVITTIGLIAQAAFNVVIFGGLASFMATQSEAGADEVGMFAGQMFGSCCYIPLGPVLGIIGSFFGAGLIHLFLMMTSNAREPFQQTLRGYCYAQAPGILNIIPVIGWLWAMGQGIWASVVMVRKVHKTSWGIAWGAALWFIGLMLLAACGLGFLIVALVGAANAG